MTKTIYILAILTVLLGTWAIALWIPAISANTQKCAETRYGISEGLQLVEQDYADAGKRHIIEDANGMTLFAIPLRNCIIDTRYRNGQLRFREQATRREGFIDHQGIITFLDKVSTSTPEDIKTGSVASMVSESKPTQMASTSEPKDMQATTKRNMAIPSVSLQTMAQGNPFYKEATKIIQGKLSEQDAKRRRMILNYCEHLRTAYTTKDIDFIRQVFSDQALIIVGNIVKPIANDSKYQATAKVSYAIHSKHDYINRLTKVFAFNKQINVKFSDFRILRHPTTEGIYGVTLRQQYQSDRYNDDGYLFLLWDFRDPAMPLIHVRTWQPARTTDGGQEVIGIQDFNLQ